jgi:hypothetical protein
MCTSLDLKQAHRSAIPRPLFVTAPPTRPSVIATSGPIDAAGKAVIDDLGSERVVREGPW